MSRTAFTGSRERPLDTNHTIFRASLRNAGQLNGPGHGREVIVPAQVLGRQAANGWMHREREAGQRTVHTATS
jgi:hypothetical protein